MPKRLEGWIPKEQREELTCKDCKQTLPREQFFARGTSKTGLRLFSARCKQCDGRYIRKNHKSYVVGKQKYKDTRREVIDRLKNACVVCGYNRCKTALEFHHLDETIKESEVSTMLASKKSLVLINEEIKKCIVLCSNCHREHHAGMLDLTPYITTDIDAF